MNAPCELGRIMYSRGMVLHGNVSKPQWRRFLIVCAETLGMSPLKSGAIWKYPIGGKGGNGYTVVQPMTESFLAIDTWPDHEGAYLFICSCKEFTVASLGIVLESFGLYAGEMTPGEVLRISPA